MVSSLSRLLLLVLVSFLLGACASISVQPTPTETEVEPVHAPTKILVRDFTFPHAEMNVDREGAELTLFEQQLARQLSYDIVQRVLAIGIDAQVAFEEHPSAQRTWLVTGHFKRTNQGSRALRSLLGFGTGGTKLETEVEVYDLAASTTAPIFTFQTTGGSGSAPGAVLSASPYTFTASAAEGATAGLSDDRRRTARMIVAYISEQLSMHGFLADDKVHLAKRVGSWSTFDGPAVDDDAPKTPSNGKRNGAKMSSK